MMRSGKGVKDALGALAADAALSWGCVDAGGAPCSPDDLIASVGPLPFSDITFDSRAVGLRTLFVCKGASFRPAFLDDAVRRGAAAYVAEHAYPGCGLPGFVVSDIRRAMARLACSFFDDPSSKTRVVGITGTKGKTTTAFYVDAVLRARAARRSALFTGLVIDDGLERVASHNTTPESVELQRHFARAVDAGCDAVVMEVSSQGLKYDRTLGTRFAVGVFTNIGEDHISDIEHPTFEDYFASKLRLFEQSACAVVNLDCDRGADVLAAARRAPRLVTYSIDPAAHADVRLAGRRRTGEGRWSLEVVASNKTLTFPFSSLGLFNVSNALAAVAVAIELGVDEGALVRGLADVHVPGRMERYDTPGGDVVGIVDYAHNEMSMEAVLTCVRTEFPGREVTVVFGSTGDRAVDRRPGLGRAAGKLADRVILTEDDPGPVPVRTICDEIGASVKAQGRDFTIIEDRAEAVHEAVTCARRPAVVVLAGKGAENSILRAQGPQPCPSDAELFCREAGIAFGGYENLP